MRKGELAANLTFFAGPLVFAVVIAAVASRSGGAIALPLVLWLVGFALFVKAKWPRLREGKLTEFGCGKMTATSKVYYVTGYAIMALGVVMAVI